MPIPHRYRELPSWNVGAVGRSRSSARSGRPVRPPPCTDPLEPGIRAPRPMPSPRPIPGRRQCARPGGGACSPPDREALPRPGPGPGPAASAVPTADGCDLRGQDLVGRAHASSVTSAPDRWTTLRGGFRPGGIDPRFGRRSGSPTDQTAVLAGNVAALRSPTANSADRADRRRNQHTRRLSSAEFKTGSVLSPMRTPSAPDSS